MSDNLRQPELVHSVDKSIPNSHPYPNAPSSTTSDAHSKSHWSYKHSRRTDHYADLIKSHTEVIDSTPSDTTRSEQNAPVASSGQREGDSAGATSGISPSKIQAIETFPEGRGPHAVPSRSSLDPKLRSPNLLSQEEPGRERPGSQTEPLSKAATSGIERNGSAASSRRAKQGEGSIKDAEYQQATPTTASTSLPNKKKSKGIPRLLSFLNCCSAPENANPVDAHNQIVPSRKVSKLPPSQVRQATPVRKPDTSAPESSTAESKETTEEKIAGPPYSDIKPAEQPKIQEQPKESVPMSAGTIFSSEDEKDELRGEMFIGQSQINESGQGPVPSASAAVPYRNDMGDSNTKEFVTPVPAMLPSKATPDQEDVIKDRTPDQEKRDSDIDMVDAPPEDPSTGETMKDAETGDTEMTPPLPPPPPNAPQNDQSIAPTNTNRNSINSTNAQNDKQNWLLPPIQPELHGKKCLVLDLDETLVHSSFKV